MTSKHAPFSVAFHFTGKKTNEEIQKIYAGFYIRHVRDALINSNLSCDEKKEIIDILIRNYTQ